MNRVSYFVGASGSFVAIAFCQSSPASLPNSSPQSFQISQSQTNTNCRRVVSENPLPFYLFLPANRTEQSAIAYNLTRGEQVGLANGTNTILGKDGVIYLRVFFPYNRANPDFGYVPDRYTTRNGTPTSTLGTCRKIMW